MKNKSSTLGVRGRVECSYLSYYWCFNKVPVYFWLNFKLQREQEIAVESMLMNQDVHVVLPTAYGKIKRMWLQAGNETTRRRLPVYQHRQRPDCQSKITWNQVCVLSRHQLWQFFFGKTLSTTNITSTCCCEKDSQFSREIWAAKVHTSSEN